MNAKVEEMINKGKAAAQAGYDKGNGLMDKVPALKSKHNKLIVWGVLAVLLVLIFKVVFCGGASDPFDVAKETMVAMFEGDLETVFSNIHIPDSMKEQLSKASEREVEQLENELVKSYVSAFGDMTDEQRELIVKLISSMECKDVKIDGNTAKVSVSLKKIDGDDGGAEFLLVQEDGEWKLDFDKSKFD